MYCRNCGNKLNGDEKFCSNCGSFNQDSNLNSEIELSSKTKDKNKRFLIVGILFLIISLILIIAPFAYGIYLCIEIMLIIFTAGLIFLIDTNFGKKLFKQASYAEFFSFKNPVYVILIIFFTILAIIFLVIYFKNKKDKNIKVEK